jgi:hypothetical protein
VSDLNEKEKLVGIVSTVFLALMDARKHSGWDITGVVKGCPKTGCLTKR